MAERVSCPNMAQIFTNQVHLKYECISDNHAMSFCAFKKTEGPTVHLQYGFSTLSTSTRNCKCKAFTTLGNLQVQAVDIRFQNDSSGICAKNQNSYLEFDSVNQVIKCQDKQLIGGYETIFNSSESSMDILLHLDGTRPIIWIAVLAPSGGNVSVVCDNTDVTVGQKTSTTMERSTVDPINTSNKEPLATTVHVEIDTTLPYELTSIHSEGINPTIFSHSKIVNTTTFTNSEIINLLKSTHLEVVNQTTSATFVQTNTNHSINLTTVTNHPTIAESMTKMKVGQKTSTTMERSTVDPIHTFNKESLATTKHVEIDTTLPYELTSTHSEGMNQATLALSKGMNQMIFSHSKVVNTTTFTNSEIINLLKSTHLEVVNQTTSATFVQTNTNHSINLTTVTNHPTIEETMSKMKAPSGGNVSVVFDNTDVTVGQKTSTTIERSTVDPIHTSNKESLATTEHVEIDTTLPYELTSTYSEGMNQASSAHSKGINPMIFSHSKVVNTTTFTNSEIINLLKTVHLEVVNQTTSATFVQTNTNHSINPTTVKNHPTIEETMSKMKAPSGGNVSVVCDNTNVTVGQRTSTTTERSTVDPIHTSNTKSLATTKHVEIDTTLSNKLTSTHSEGMNQASSAHSKGINPTIFSHSKVVNTTTFTNSEIINLLKSTHLEMVNQTTSATFVQTNTNHSINPTTVTNHPTIAESMSKMKDDNIDPAIIVLALTGSLTLVLIVVGIIIGRMKYVNQRQDRKPSDDIPERKNLDKANTSIRMNLYQEIEISQRPTSRSGHITYPTMKEDQPVYSQVQKKRRSDQISDQYDHFNYMGSFKSKAHSNIYDQSNTINYDHCQLQILSSDCHNHDKLEVNNSETSFTSLRRNILVHPHDYASPNQESRVNIDEQHINPYVDETVIKGMKNDYELRKSLSPSIDVYESIRDMMTHATSWAEEDSLGQPPKAHF